MTLEELQKEIDSLPRQDSKFVIGWLMSQVLDLVNLIEERAMKRRDPNWRWLRALKHKIVLAKKGKGSYNRKVKHGKELAHDE